MLSTTTATGVAQEYFYNYGVLSSNLATGVANRSISTTTATGVATRRSKTDGKNQEDLENVRNIRKLPVTFIILKTPKSIPEQILILI